MARHLHLEIDRAEQLEGRIYQLAKQTSKKLEGVEIEADLLFRNPEEYKGKNHEHSGFVGVTINFNGLEPTFLCNSYKQNWVHDIKREAARKFQFDLGTIGKTALDYMEIEFEAPSEDALYELTAEKEKILKKGFDQVSEFVEWYCEKVRGYSCN